MIKNIDYVPIVQDFDDNEKHKSKLLVFDDFSLSGFVIRIIIIR
jgi:hypothetical protein